MSDNIVIWNALADSKRRQIVNLLEEKPRTTSEISEYFDVSRFAIMKHLKVLEQAELIKTRREGRQRWNILNDDLVHFLRTKLASDDGDSPYQLMDILGLFPGRKPDESVVSVPTTLIHIKQTVLLEASPSQVFAALTTGVDAWWSQRLAANSQVYMEPYVNGRFYEAFNKAGQGLLYAIVTYIKQDEALQLKGPMGLTRQVADYPTTDNFVHIQLEQQNSATQLILSHWFNSVADEMTRDIYMHRWRTLLNQHLKSFLEKGIPYQHNP